MPLFNTTHPSYQPHFLRNLVNDVTPDPNAGPVRPRIRTDFGQSTQASAIVAEKPASLSTYNISGYFATVRAALVINAISMGAYDAGGLPRYLAAQLPTAEDPSPTTDANTSAYSDLQVMSYLPPQTAPSQDTFANLNDPTKREAAMTSLSDTIHRTSAAQTQSLDNVIPSNLPLIPFVPSVPPWGNLLCNQSQFGVTIQTNAVALNPGTGSTVLQPSNVPGFVSQ
ncbi:MAG: hypothetical protein WC869_00530 [Phycisphaerae bacterium]|jgi:hypothetical protein